MFIMIKGYESEGLEELSKVYSDGAAFICLDFSVA